MPSVRALQVEDWESLLSRATMRRAANLIAEQAELLAGEMDAGRLEDRGGPDALRLLAAIVRLNAEGSPTVGTA